MDDASWKLRAVVQAVDGQVISCLIYYYAYMKTAVCILLASEPTQLVIYKCLYMYTSLASYVNFRTSFSAIQLICPTNYSWVFQIGFLIISVLKHSLFSTNLWCLFPFAWWVCNPAVFLHWLWVIKQKEIVAIRSCLPVFGYLSQAPHLPHSSILYKSWKQQNWWWFTFVSSRSNYGNLLFLMWSGKWYSCCSVF